MSDALYLAARYMLHHRVKTTILVGSLTILLFLPLGLEILVSRTAQRLRARAEDLERLYLHCAEYRGATWAFACPMPSWVPEDIEDAEILRFLD